MHFYDFVSYCGMLTDSARLDAYVGALTEIITPESVVLDLGAGTGVFSVISCELGARKVYAVEVNPLIKLVQETAAARGIADRLEIIQKHSGEVELEEKANVLVTDIHGAFPLYESSIETIIDARERLLTDDAILLPSRETIYFAVSEAEDIYEKQVSRYLREFHGFKIPASDRLVRNRWVSMRSEHESLLTPAAVFAEIDYREVEDTSFSAEMEWTIERNGVAHGLRGWFENVLYGDHGVSNSIDARDSTYAAPFFPFEHPVEVIEGDRVTARVAATYDSGDYAWSWRTAFRGPEGPQVKAEFNQTVMASLVIDPKAALKRSEYFAPKLGLEGEIDSLILTKMDGETLSGDIADLLIEKYPEKFGSFEEAIERVYSMTGRYSEP